MVTGVLGSWFEVVRGLSLGGLKLVRCMRWLVVWSSGLFRGYKNLGFMVCGFGGS